MTPFVPSGAIDLVGRRPAARAVRRGAWMIASDLAFDIDVSLYRPGGKTCPRSSGGTAAAIVQD